MILVDSTVWIDHLRGSDPTLVRLLEMDHVLAHPFVVAELALGNLRQRDVIIGWLRDLPCAATATDDELLHFIERHKLAGVGIGLVDAHLLASVTLDSGARLWTRDRRLRRAAERIGCEAHLA
ncbi:MAG: PIN domain-containing protein [Geminicoccaceae bacterium]